MIIVCDNTNIAEVFFQNQYFAKLDLAKGAVYGLPRDIFGDPTSTITVHDSVRLGHVELRIGNFSTDYYDARMFLRPGWYHPEIPLVILSDPTSNITGYSPPGAGQETFNSDHYYGNFTLICPYSGLPNDLLQDPTSNVTLILTPGAGIEATFSDNYYWLKANLTLGYDHPEIPIVVLLGNDPTSSVTYHAPTHVDKIEPGFKEAKIEPRFKEAKIIVTPTKETGIHLNPEAK